jgi:pimeloyl-ACP methyl ester carboxylesterase
VPYGNDPRLANPLSHGELCTLAGVGHVPFLEVPETFAAIACDWFTSQERSK